MEEVWTAPELGLVMAEIYENEKHVRTMSEVERIERTEPDPALFQISG